MEILFSEYIRTNGIEVKELSRFSQDFMPEITEKLRKIVKYIIGNLTGN